MTKQITKQWTRALVAAVMVLMTAHALAQNSKYQEGVHYFKIDQASAPSPDGKIDVTEAFSYMCAHCNTFEPFISSWQERKPDYVEFNRLPVIFGRKTWELYARAYVTAEMMGIANEAHEPLMDALWKEKKIMRNMEELGEFYSGFGVSAQSFVATSESFAVDAKLRKDQRLSQTWGVSGTPTVIVNGKYLVKGSEAVPNYDTLLDVVNSLVAIEAAAMASTEGAAPETAAEG
jgi:thiol:disulfide interchange protein DsbA